jgi:tyrosyl-tRNA synthetase
MTNNVFDVLKERGFIAQVTDEDGLRQRLAEGALTLYNGFDATADSLHAGHLVPIMAMLHLQHAGHRSIGLVGGGTTMIGDPSGRTEMRQMLDPETIQANVQKIHAQMNHYLKFDEGQGIAENNAAWLLDINYITFLREIGRHFSVNRMLAAEAYKQRLEHGLSFIEFNYQLIQAYDFLKLYRRHGCILQTGGDDQWSNILAGVDLIRRVEGVTVYAITYPLLTTANGAKMGKTAAGAVWLDPDKCSPYDFYQYWINCDDQDVEKLLKIFTLLPMDEIKRLAALEGAELQEAKRVLAYEATRLAHGETEAQAAEQGAKAVFAGGGDLTAIPMTTLPMHRLENGLGLLEIFTEVGLTKSRSDARRMVQQGGIYVNETRVDEAEMVLTLADMTDQAILLRAGKKKYHRLVFN